LVAVFAYGTLRPSLYPRAVVNFNLTPKGRATLRGPFQMLHLGGFPGLIHDYRLPVSTIIGEVVEVENLIRLDGYEGYTGGDGGLYNRKEVVAKFDDGSSVHCWVYTFNCDPRFHDPIDPTGPKAKVVASGDWGKR
jgi:gamma-glutamylcyclotransferase (GGCT)/AIG2-like uncharacterized protein YtfP